MHQRPRDENDILACQIKYKIRYFQKQNMRAKRGKFLCHWSIL